jgi:hypothetical protein
MTYFKHLRIVLPGIAIGLIFIFLPTKNVNYKPDFTYCGGTAQTCGLYSSGCTWAGSQTSGIKKLGIPMLYKTEYYDYCHKTPNTYLVKYKMVSDFIIGLTAGMIAALVIFRLIHDLKGRQ